MTAIIRRPAAAMIIMAIISLGAFFHADTVSAQPFTCPNLTIVNNTGAFINLCLQDGFGAIQCFPVPPGGPILFPPFVPVGAVTPAGNFYPFNPGAGCFGCTPCIMVQPPTCATVCYDPVCCAVWIFPCDPTAPCLP
jgi:hypothetical protein